MQRNALGALDLVRDVVDGLAARLAGGDLAHAQAAFLGQAGDGGLGFGELGFHLVVGDGRGGGDGAADGGGGSGAAGGFVRVF